MPESFCDSVHIGVFYQPRIAAADELNIHLVLVKPGCVLAITGVAKEVQHQCFNTSRGPISPGLQISSSRLRPGTIIGRSFMFKIPVVIPHRQLTMVN